MVNISQNEFDDFMEEDDTNQIIKIEDEINSSVSVAGDDFNARAIMLGYSVDQSRYWNEKLNPPEQEVFIIEDEDIIYLDDLQ